jgi:hypothetical protein
LLLTNSSQSIKMITKEFLQHVTVVTVLLITGYYLLCYRPKKKV